MLRVNATGTGFPALDFPITYSTAGPPPLPIEVYGDGPVKFSQSHAFWSLFVDTDVTATLPSNTVVSGNIAGGGTIVAAGTLSIKTVVGFTGFCTPLHPCLTASGNRAVHPITFAVFVRVLICVCVDQLCKRLWWGVAHLQPLPIRRSPSKSHLRHPFSREP